MKKLVLLMMLLFAGASVNAAPIWFDADGVGTDYDAVLITELSGTATSGYFTTVDFGGDSTLGEGDTFTEDFIVRINEAYFDDNNPLTNDKVADYPDEAGSYDPSLWATISLTGSVINYDDGGTATTVADVATTILDDTFELDFNLSVGGVKVYYDADYAVAPAPFTLGTFDVVDGGSDLFENVNGTLTSDVGLTLLDNTLSAGVWFVDNNGVKGADVTTMPYDDVLLALADSSVNLTGFFPVPVLDNLGEVVGLTDFVNILIEDNGTDIEFEPVPEPSTIILLGSGLLGLAYVGRKRRK